MLFLQYWRLKLGTPFTRAIFRQLGGFTSLYDATGRDVASLANGFMDAGEHDVPFQRNDLPSGVYFYRLESGGQSQTRAMVILP